MAAIASRLPQMKSANVSADREIPEPKLGPTLDPIFLRIVPERAIRHLEKVRGLRADASGGLKCGQKIGAFNLLDVLFEIEPSLR